MSDDERQALFATVLNRIEVAVAPAAGRDEGTVWSVHVNGVSREDENAPEAVIVSGYLSINGPAGFGQAQVAGILWGRDIELELGDQERLHKFMTEIDVLYLEPMYDTARRALQSQASQMDFQFDLDVQAPRAQMHIPVSEDDEPSGQS